MNKRITFTLVVSLLTASTALADLSNGLVAHYKLDATSGAVVDETGNYDGVNYGATRGIAGKEGNAFDFDGSDYVGTSLIPSTCATASMWIYPEDDIIGGFLGTGSTTNGGKDGWAFEYVVQEVLGIRFWKGNGVAGYIFTNIGSVPLGEFSHIAVVVNDTEIGAYINGELSGTTTLSSSPDAHDRGLMIGRHFQSGAGASTMRGIIDEVRIYNRALDQSEIAELYDGEPECPELPEHDPWSFVHITDSHVGCLGAQAILASAIDAITQMDPKPDFVLFTGDIVNSAWFNTLGIRWARGAYENFAEALEPLDDCGIEHHEVPGNHDRYVYGYYPPVSYPCIPDYYFYSQDLSQYGAYLGGANYYSFTPPGKNIVFIGLDSGADVAEGVLPILPLPSGEDLRGTGLTEGQMIWLNGLDFCSPKVVFMHHPAVHTTAGEMVIANNRGRFIEFCKTNNVQLVLTGHTHQSHILDADATDLPVGSTQYPQFIQTPSVSDTKSWLLEDILHSDPLGYRVVDVANNKTYPRAYSLTPFPLSTLSFPTLALTLLSPGNMHVYDSGGQHVGLTTSGEAERGIPRAFYFSPIVTDDGIKVLPEQIIIFNSLDDYVHEVVGTEEGIYGLNITSTSPGEETNFEATEIPTSPGAKHRYVVDWAALGAGEEGVILEIDADGDGVFEKTLIADQDLTSEEFALQTETAIDFYPDTLNLGSKGKYVTVYIELPEGVDVSQIDVSSLKLNDTVTALPKPVATGDYDDDGTPDLMVKFDRQEVSGVLEPGEQIVNLTGRLADGTPLAGMDTIRVLAGKGAKKGEQEAVLDVAGVGWYFIEEATFSLIDAADMIDALERENFSNNKSATKLSSGMDLALAMIDEGLYEDALDILENDILTRTDGCAETGEPDGNDWITTYEGQGEVYPLIMDAIEFLESLI